MTHKNDFENNEDELNELALLEEETIDEEEGLDLEELDGQEEINYELLFPRTLADNNLTTTLLKPNIGNDVKLKKDFVLSGVVKADHTNTSVAGTAGETTLNSFTFNPDELHKQVVIRIWAAGVYTTDDATATVDIKLKSSSATNHTITTTAGVVGSVPWFVQWVNIVNVIGSSGTVESFAHAQTNNVNKDSANTVSNTLNTTIAQTFSVTATWANGSAGDTIDIRQFIVEILN